MCGKYKPSSEFHKNSTTCSGYEFQCKDCRKEYYKEKGKIYSLKKKYGLTFEEYDELLERQNSLYKMK